MTPILIKLLPMAITLGLVAGNMDEIERFYKEVTAQTQYVTNGMDMRHIGMMLDRDYLTKGRYPAETAFAAWMQASFKENLVRELVVDTWGTPFRYTTSNRNKAFRLVSAGPDTRYDTEDDLIYTGP